MTAVLPGLNDAATLAAILVSENRRATEDEEQQIRRAIPSLRKDLQQVKSEFNDVDIALAIRAPGATPAIRLTQELARLSLRLSEARETLATHMNAIKYGWQMPVEVLEIIFQMCLPDTDYVSPNTFQAPLLLCQVCGSWRKVALFTPSLWSSLSIRLARRPGLWKDFLDSWLGRSGGRPISLSITGFSQSYHFDEHILKLVVKHSKRWQRLRLDGVRATTRATLLNTCMPLLETLEISGGRVHIFPADIPRLRTLSILDENADLASVHLPLERLTVFSASRCMCTLEKCFAFLAEAKNLTSCTIQLSPTASWATPQHFLPVHLPHLRKLILIRVGAIGDQATTAFFRHAQLPCLDSLELVSSHPESTFELGPYPIFLAPARRSNLRSLHLTGGQPRDKGLLDTVIAIPSLKVVVITSGSGAEKPLPRDVQETLNLRS